MAKVCHKTGKKPATGNNVSHSNRRTRRRWEPNLQKKRIFNSKTGKWEKVKISTHGIRILNKQVS